MSNNMNNSDSSDKKSIFDESFKKEEHIVKYIHLPESGGAVESEAAAHHVLYASFEAVPFFKSGGLGEVAGSLPYFLNGSDFEVRVILPKLSLIPQEYQEKMVFKTSFTVPLGWRSVYCGLFEMKYKGLTYYFLDNEYYFHRNKAYGEFDDGERIAYFSKALLEAIEYMGWRVDILHCNDWHTAMSTVFLREHYNHLPDFNRIKTVFTIHNLKFQGQYDDAIMSDILGLSGTPAEPQMSVYNKYGKREAVNYLLGAISYSDRITTVSPTYSEEIKTPYFGENQDAVFRKRASVLSGIVNGIDWRVFNPQVDKFIPVQYDVNSIDKKVEDKLAIQKELYLKVGPNIPVFAIICRLTEQKGLDLVINKLAEMEKRAMQLIVLGSGDKKYENAFAYYTWKNPEKFQARLYFDEGISHRIYAGADAVLMPSRFEPCGLSQMIAMQYGTLPIVRETGGLKDTVQPYNKYDKSGTGFSFANYSADELMGAIDNALTVFYNEKADWRKMQRECMTRDFSWRGPAEQYRELYRGLLK